MIILLAVLAGAAAQRGHYIVDYQRLPLYQEFYLSPGLYRPLFPASTGTKSETGHHEPRRIEVSSRHQKQTHVHGIQLAGNSVQAAPAPAATPQAQALESSKARLDQSHPVVVQDNTLTTSSASQEEPVVVVAATQEHPQPVVAQHEGHQTAVVPSQQEHSQNQQVSESALPVLTYSNSMTQDGSYSYKYETGDGLMREESSVMEPNGEDGALVPTVRGSYSYPGPDGRTIRVDYVADGGGFRASGDHLPQSLQDTVYNFKYVIP